MGRKPDHHSNLNKGAWSAAEDQILIDFVKKHGEGKWERVLKHTSLRRCGKSCRMRWLNYLRPDIKRGNISEDEEELIFRLHKLLGNRWSLIARRLPGRTDNEIKNYWNSTLRKKLQLGGDQPKNPKPRKRITMKAAPPVAIEDQPSDQSLAASAVNPEGSLANRRILKSEDWITSPVASEKDGCPWDSMLDHGVVEACFSEFLDSYTLDVGGPCTPVGPEQCDNRFDRLPVVSPWENLEDGELYEEMLHKWAAELINS